MAAAAAVTCPVPKAPPLQHLGSFRRQRRWQQRVAAAHQQAALANLGTGVGRFNLGLTSPGLGMPNGLNMAQLAQLNGITGMNGGMNPFNMNMLGMANLSAMDISPEAQLLAAQIAAAGGGFGQANLAGLGGLGGFGGMQSNIGGDSADRAGPETALPASAPTAKVDHHPQATAAARRKTKKISTRWCLTT
jgi:hypothetical protein